MTAYFPQECYIRRNFLTDNPVIYEIVDDTGCVRNFGDDTEISRLLGTDDWSTNDAIFLVYDEPGDYGGHYVRRSCSLVSL